MAESWVKDQWERFENRSEDRQAAAFGCETATRRAHPDSMRRKKQTIQEFLIPAFRLFLLHVGLRGSWRP